METMAMRCGNKIVFKWLLLIAYEVRGYKGLTNLAVIEDTK